VVADNKVLATSKVPTYSRLVSRTRKVYVDTYALTKLIEGWKHEFDFRWCAIESVHASPQMGKTSAFSFGHTFGLLLGVLGGVKISHVKGIEPSVWKPRLGLSQDKQKSLDKYKEIFDIETKNDGEAEAALIGYFAQRQLNSQVVDAMS
jgi:hypothetical protein